MQIITVQPKKKDYWNQFVTEHFPPVGAFLQSWEWGDFKHEMNLSVHRYAVTENGKWIGCFQMEIHSLPFGLRYGYAPRGPVFKKKIMADEKLANDTYEKLAKTLLKKFPKLAFIRFEPPHHRTLPCYNKKPWKHLSYYLQPRYNQTIALHDEEKIMFEMSSDVKHDIRSAKRLEITTEAKHYLTEGEKLAFEEMKIETAGRSGKNIFPSSMYFAHLLDKLGTVKSVSNHEPYLKFFVASKGGLPIALYMAVFFACTVTYLYGASYSGTKSKRAPAYLHFMAMLHAKEEGYKYYDLGGVDQKLWPGLTYFKKQFGGKTMEYAGTIDLVMKPLRYRLYSLAKDLSFLKNKLFK